ncbi:MAG: protein phosphatase 2C domain-containing protein [Saprospiraceae bacterium]
MQYIAQSIPNKGKLKNGDSYRFFEDEHAAIALVADGVGGNACDWKASEQACEDLVYYYQAAPSGTSVLDAVALSLRKTYARLYQTKGECEGMLSTLVGVVLDKTTSEYFYFGVGDSTILRFQDDQMEELPTQSSFYLPIDYLPTRVQNGGVWEPKMSFALMTDGITANRKAYQSEIALVLRSPDWETRLGELMQLNQLTQSDDMTLMLLRG